MQKRILLLLVFTLFCLTILWSGCGGSGSKAQDSSLEILTRAHTPITYTDDSNYFYSAVITRLADLKQAKAVLQDNEITAKKEIASKLAKRFSELFQTFLEESGMRGDTEVLTMTDAVSRDAVSVLLQRVEVRKNDISKQGNLFYGSVVMAASIPEANAVFLGKIKENEVLHSRIKASQSFRDLEREVAKYE